jgi:hypothetical protein
MAMHDCTPSERFLYDILWEFHSFLLGSENGWTTRTRKKAKEVTMVSGAWAARVSVALVKIVQEASKKIGLQETVVHGTCAGEVVVKIKTGSTTGTTQMLMMHKHPLEIGPVSAVEKALNQLTNTRCGKCKTILPL